MFPINLDGFQFAFYGFATLAASVGYAWTRNMASKPLSGSSDDTSKQTNSHRVVSPPLQHDTPSSPKDGSNSASHNFSTVDSQSLSEPTESTSRKRKYSDDDASPEKGCPDDLSSDYPNKRSKTPSDTDSELVRTPLADESLTLEVPLPLSMQEGPTATSKDICEQAVLAYTESEGLILPISEPAFHPTTEIPHSPVPHLSRPSSRPGTPSAKSVTTNGFASFANVDSPFRTMKQVTHLPAAKEKPVWQENTTTESVDNVNPLAAEPVLQNSYTHLTGEENEIVESELKGVKLYKKYGSKDFSDGLIGHIKLLSNKNSESERLLFRREPLWQVSMNIRLHPLVRCSFDEESHTLRLITKEPVEQANMPIEQRPQEIAIYVVKRGRVPKETFCKFAKALLASNHLSCSAS